MISLLALLRQNRNYRYTWLGQVVSETGDYFNNVAVFALVMEKSGSGLVVSGVMLARASSAGGTDRGSSPGPPRPAAHHDRERWGAGGGGAGISSDHPSAAPLAA